MVSTSSADALGGIFAFEIRDVDYCVAGGDSSLCDDVFDPGDVFAVGRDSGLFEAVRGRERVDDVLRWSGGFWFCGGGETRFGGLLGSSGLRRGSFLRIGFVCVAN